MTLTRRSLLVRGSGLVAGTVAGTGLVAESASAAPLTRTSLLPFEPQIEVSYPANWKISTDFMTEVLLPHHVAISNRPLNAVKDVDGQPDMRSLPHGTALLLVYFGDLDPETDRSWARSLDAGIRVSDMSVADNEGGGVVKRYFAWYVYGDSTLTAYGLLGDGAEDHDGTLREVIDSARLAA